jgi:hypothetical protein
MHYFKKKKQKKKLEHTCLCWANATNDSLWIPLPSYNTPKYLIEEEIDENL